MTSRYTATDNCLQELASMEKPNPGDRPRGDNAVWDADEWRQKWTAHIASLRKIKCDFGCRGIFVDGREYEENKDYKLEKECKTYYESCAMGSTCNRCLIVAFPMRVPISNEGMTTNDWMKVDYDEQGDDELKGSIDTVLVAYIDHAGRELAVEGIVAELKKQFIITKR